MCQIFGDQQIFISITVTFFSICCYLFLLVYHNPLPFQFFFFKFIFVFDCFLLCFQFKKISYVFNYVSLFRLFAQFLSVPIHSSLAVILRCVYLKKTYNFVFKTADSFSYGLRNLIIQPIVQSVFNRTFLFHFFFLQIYLYHIDTING